VGAITAIREFLADRSGGFAPGEAHAISYQDIWGSGGDWPSVPVHAGVEVSQTSALRVSVVWRCIRLISETLAALPADAVRKRGEIREPVDRPPRWLSMPNPETSWFEFIERIMESLLMDGNAFVLIASRDPSTLYPNEVWTLNPRAVTVEKKNGRVRFVWDGTTVLSRYGPTDPAGDVLHIKLATAGGLRGMSPIEAARQSIGLALVTEKSGGKFFGKGGQMQGVIQMPPAASPALAREYVELMRETWKAHHTGSDRAYETPGFLTGGAEWQNVTMSMEDAQFLQTRSFQVEDIATRFYGVPPQFVGLTEKQTSWGTGLEEQSLAFVRFTLLPHIVRLETALSQLTPLGQFIRFNQRGLVRADSKTEGDILTQRLQNGVLSFNDFLAKFDEPPRPGGDRYMIPANMELLEADGSKAKAPVPPGLDEPTPSPNGNGRVIVPAGSR
jgi:HK97 family phage portal protein